MEASNNDRDANANVKPPPLNSDQLNYLIWRYLQEQGYGEAAVKLQRDWNVDLEQLPFARHIKGQALVSLVQKGLRYHHLSQTIDENGRSSKALQPSMFFFGADSAQPHGATRETLMRPGSSRRTSSPDTTTNGVRKHPREGIVSDALDLLAQPAPKRPRKTGNANALAQPAAGIQDSETNAGMEVDEPNSASPLPMPANAPTRPSRPADAEFDESSAGINGRSSGRGMDVDSANAITGAGPRVGALEPQDQEQMIEPVPPPPTLANGDSVGVQADPAKIADLTPASSLLATPEGQHVTNILWRPGDATILTATGVQFCGLWKTSETTRHQPVGQSPQYHTIFEQSDDTIVSAIAWEPNGTRLAIATYTNQVGQLHIYDGEELSLMETLPASQRVITGLRWLPAGSKLVGVAPYDANFPNNNKSTAVMLWDLSDPSTEVRTSTINVVEIIFDVDTATSTQGYAGGTLICLGGDGVVYQCRDSGRLTIEKRWTSAAFNRDRWDYVRCARRSQLVVAASAESASIWIPAGDLVLRGRHNAAIVDLQIRPATVFDRSRGLTEEFATASMDNTIKVWRYDFPSNTADVLFKVLSPSMSLSYSSDGAYFAGAGYDKLRVWSADHGHQPLAAWDGTGTGWRGASIHDDDTTNGEVNSMNGDLPGSSGDHSLSWDGDGKKIAFGLGDQVAIIDFQR